ncbi:MAG: type I restriction-modification system subunit M [Acidobacteria bacterium]|nr:type I restriction-modification system subunit M [Acidobacteriota bacterium]
MTTQDVVQKLWNLCNVLRDDGITYHQYVTELTNILFLKMAKETGMEKNIKEEYRWDRLVEKKDYELMKFYKQLLKDLGKKGLGRISQIYANAATNIEEPRNLEKIIKAIDHLDWYSAKEEGLGDIYEGLLEKNAGDKKSGAGQYFTPRPLINVIVRLINPQPGERCNDPAAGTFGFMVAANRYIKEKTNNYNDMKVNAPFQKDEAFTGCELVQETHRLALMNAVLHDINGEIAYGDTLSTLGERFKNYDVVLTNPPFGTKKSSERPTRSDINYKSTNKQFNFLQHIYLSLKPNGQSRAAVVMPDNILFQNGDGKKIRAEIMDKCNLHTILRLPSGIFYAPGVKTNVLFFTRGKNDNGNTNEIFFYDLRTNMPSFGRTNPLTESNFKEFEESFHLSREEKLKITRWSVFSREQVTANGNNLDLGLIKDDSVISYEDLPDPTESAEVAIAKLNQAADLIAQVVKELRISGGAKDE